MMSARSTVPWDMATPQKRLEFNRAVMARVEMGMGSKSKRLPHLTTSEFENLIRGGAEYYCEHYSSNVDRSQAERNRLPVEDSWQPPYGSKGKPERGIHQLGSLGGGNHFMELQRCIETDTLFSRCILAPVASGMGLLRTFSNWQRRSILSNAILIWDTSRLTPPTGRIISMQSMREETMLS